MSIFKKYSKAAIIFAASAAFIGPAQAGVAAPILDYSKGRWVWDCQPAAGPGADSGVRITYENSAIASLQLDQYPLMRHGRVLKDSEIGIAVFDVRVGKLQFSQSGIGFKVSLQDYSDQESWSVHLIFERGGPVAVVNSTFQSSDGDGLLHRSKQTYECQATGSLNP